MVQRERHVGEDMSIEMKHDTINPATKLVIPRKRHRDLRPAVAERRAGIQKRPCDYWIPAFARMTGRWISVTLFNCQVNTSAVSKMMPIAPAMLSEIIEA